MKFFARSAAPVLLATMLCSPGYAQVAAVPKAQGASAAPVIVEPALDGVFRAFGNKPVVALGDPHGLAEQMDFYAAVVRDPRFARDVRNVASWFTARGLRPDVDALIERLRAEAGLR